MTRRVLFLDLETTGFDPNRDVILEVGAILVDLDAAAELFEFHAFPTPLHAGGRFHPRIDRGLDKMHATSGLFFDRVRASHVDDWEHRLLDRVDEHGFARGELSMGGFSPSFDRSFLAVHAPDLDAYLSHRMVDASTLRFCGVELPPGDAKHRALEDCRSAIACVRRGLALIDIGLAHEKGPPCTHAWTTPDGSGPCLSCGFVR